MITKEHFEFLYFLLLGENLTSVSVSHIDFVDLHNEREKILIKSFDIEKKKDISL